jgi:hypothetical protein
MRGDGVEARHTVGGRVRARATVQSLDEELDRKGRLFPFAHWVVMEHMGNEGET